MTRPMIMLAATSAATAAVAAFAALPMPAQAQQSSVAEQTEAWANKAKVLETVGSTGINSCSPVGPGGYTGCLTRVIKEARDQRKQSNDDTTPPQ